MGRKIVCPSCSVETLKYNIDRVHRWHEFRYEEKEFKCLRCNHRWFAPKTCAEMRQDKWYAEEYYHEWYPHSSLLKRLEAEHTSNLVHKQNRNRKTGIERMKTQLARTIRKAKRTGNRSKLSFYLPDPPKAKH